MLIETLKEFGLSEKEAKTYLALLKLEVATANEIATESGVNRSSTYVILESLKKQGFVAMSDDALVQKYVATSPEMILNIARNKAKKQKDVEEKIEKALPELKALHKDTKHKPKVYVYTSQEAIKLGFDEIFEEQAAKGMKVFRVFENTSDILEVLPKDFIKNDAKFLSKSKVKMRLISPKTKDTVSVKNQYESGGVKNAFALIPENKFYSVNKSDFDLSVYEDKVEFFSPKDSFLILIESKEIADVIKNVFDLAWERSKELEKGKTSKND